MHILFDARCIRGTGDTGVGRMARCVMNAVCAIPSPHRFSVLCEKGIDVSLKEQWERDGLTVYEWKKTISIFSAHIFLARFIDQLSIDVVHVLGGVAPLFLRTPMIVTVHDTLIWEHPEWFPAQWFSPRVAFPHMLRRARAIHTFSYATAQTLAAKGLTAVVTTPGPFPLGVARVPSPSTVLMVGTIEPRKNYLRAIGAMRLVREKIPTLHLHIIGRRGWRAEERVQEIQRAVAEGWCVWDEDADDGIRDYAYAHASLLFFPSLGEGFGIPLREAQSIGLPVVCADLPVFREVMGEGTTFVDPQSVEDVARGIIACVQHPMVSQKENIPSWDAFGKAVFAIYQNANLV